MRAIVFDLDGTLLRPSGSYAEVLTAAFETTTGFVDDDWFETYDTAFFEAFESFDPSPVEAAVATIDGGPDPGAFADALLEAEIERFEPPPGTFAALDRLGADSELAVCTNGVGDWQRAKLRAHDLLAPFDAVVTSYEVGAHKPDPAPFRAVEAATSADAYLMVGDGDADVDGARAVGWETVRYEGGDLPSVADAIGPYQ
ncbi:HAD family hydrolase [Halovivax limisalsi]|uniref:HAD family hydrolase n=1 Tax=Halovivax limisalsi TaxID=1453760 RepID=UPI001FFC390A|nr:HAD family hydrolase [Halovivax limisalsi]